MSSEGFDWAEALKAARAEEEAKRQRYEERVNALPGDPVERWLEQYPVEHHPKLLGEISGRHHEGATFELMLHALLLAQGFDVEVSSGTPDFRVASPSLGIRLMPLLPARGGGLSISA